MSLIWLVQPCWKQPEAIKQLDNSCSKPLPSMHAENNSAVSLFFFSHRKINRGVARMYGMCLKTLWVFIIPSSMLNFLPVPSNYYITGILIFKYNFLLLYKTKHYKKNFFKGKCKKKVMYFLDLQASIWCDIIGRHKPLLYLLYASLCYLILRRVEKTIWLPWPHFHNLPLITPTSLSKAIRLVHLCTNRDALKICWYTLNIWLIIYL